jgi:hypothetical protein
MKKLFILSVLLLGLLKICYAQDYIFMTQFALGNPEIQEEIYSCYVEGNGDIDNCQSIYTIPQDYYLISSPVIANQNLIFSYGYEKGDPGYQIFQTCPILPSGTLGDCTQNIINNDGTYLYGFIVGYQQPSTSADKLKLSNTESKSIEIA